MSSNQTKKNKKKNVSIENAYRNDRDRKNSGDQGRRASKRDSERRRRRGKGKGKEKECSNTFRFASFTP